MSGVGSGTASISAILISLVAGGPGAVWQVWSLKRGHGGGGKALEYGHWMAPLPLAPFRRGQYLPCGSPGQKSLLRTRAAALETSRPSWHHQAFAAPITGHGSRRGEHADMVANMLRS